MFLPPTRMLGTARDRTRTVAKLSMSDVKDPVGTTVRTPRTDMSTRACLIGGFRASSGGEHTEPLARLVRPDAARSEPGGTTADATATRRRHRTISTRRPFRSTRFAARGSRPHRDAVGSRPSTDTALYRRLRCPGVLGEGGMGIVFRARHVRLDRPWP